MNEYQKSQELKSGDKVSINVGIENIDGDISHPSLREGVFVAHDTCEDYRVWCRLGSVDINRHRRNVSKTY